MATYTLVIVLGRCHELAIDIHVQFYKDILKQFATIGTRPPVRPREGTHPPERLHQAGHFECFQEVMASP